MSDALIRRLHEHAAKHDALAFGSPVERQYADDLREAARWVAKGVRLKDALWVAEMESREGGQWGMRDMNDFLRREAADAARTSVPTPPSASGPRQSEPHE